MIWPVTLDASVIGSEVSDARLRVHKAEFFSEYSVILHEVFHMGRVIRDPYLKLPAKDLSGPKFIVELFIRRAVSRNGHGGRRVLARYHQMSGSDRPQIFPCDGLQCRHSHHGAIPVGSFGIQRRAQNPFPIRDRPRVFTGSSVTTIRRGDLATRVTNHGVWANSPRSEQIHDGDLECRAQRVAELCTVDVAVDTISFHFLDNGPATPKDRTQMPLSLQDAVSKSCIREQFDTHAAPLGAESQ